jgi:hypothetical protein
MTWNEAPEGCEGCVYSHWARDRERDWTVLYCELDDTAYFEAMDADGHCSSRKQEE